MFNRREFLYSTLLAVAGSKIPGSSPLYTSPNSTLLREKSEDAPFITDTNVNLFQWPFRRLAYSQTDLLISKLKKHRINKAWAGSYEALFHKDLAGANLRLADECRKYGDGMLVPFGTVNVGWPGWEEDLRRCHEQYNMPGIRIYPGYQAFDFDHPDFSRFLQIIADRKLILQIACDMEDSRVHHPVIEIRDISMNLLPELANAIPEIKIQLLYWNHKIRGSLLERFITDTTVVLDTTRIETNGGVGRLIEGDPWSGSATPLPVNRLLFGSHMPYFPVEANILKLFESSLSLNQLKAIMNENANQLLVNSQ